LLALLVEKTSGQSLPDFLRDNVFKPAGMTHPYVQTAMSQKQDRLRTKTYEYNNHYEMKLELMDTLVDWREWTYNLALITGGSGVNSTTGDMLLFDRALSQGKLLKAQTLEEAYAPYKLNNGKFAEPLDIAYSGLGWFIFKDDSHGRIVWESGANPGVISFFARNLKLKQAIVVMHNAKCDPFVSNFPESGLFVLVDENAIYQ
jgi:CubicO group peptidase (beta-lactamase class C family)